MRLAVFALALVICACDSDPETRAIAITRTADASPFIGKGDGPSNATVATTRPDTSAGDTSAGDTSAGDTSAGDTSSPPDTSSPADTLVPEDVVITPGQPALVVAPVYAIPWVAAGAGASTLAVVIDNLGDPGDVLVEVVGASAITVVDAPTSVEDTLAFTLRFAGAATPSTVTATLRVSAGGTTATAAVWAVAGNSTLPSASWTTVATGTTTYGRSATVHLASAPFPHTSASYTDDRVDIFVPDGFRRRGPVDYVVHFHGFGTTIAATLPAHKYREQLWASGMNAVLVTPQGPVNADSGNFGKLMEAGGLARLLADVDAVLYRAGVIDVPQTGDVVLTEHSGGYQGVAQNLGAQLDQGQVVVACLFDGLYARQSQFLAFAQAGGWIRSDYSTSGGTLANNQAFADTLPGRVEEAKTFEALRNADSVVWFTPAQHNDTTWWQMAYAETLRWSSVRSRRGPRLELQEAVASGGTATIGWLAPEDDDLTGFAIETATLTGGWREVTRVGPDAASATFPLSGGERVRVVPLVDGVARADALPSDEYWVEDGADVLVVDGFDRMLGGSWHDLRHGFMARVGAAAHAHTVSNEAVSEGAFDLTKYRVVLWLVGDESVADRTLDAVEQAKAKAYVDGGGHLVISGSEVAYDLKSNGATFLGAMGATFASDDANNNIVEGVGAIDIGTVAFGGASAPYPEDFPDTLATASGATSILQYGNGMTAAVGRAGKSAVVGFPLETIESQSDLDTVVAALMGFVAP